MSKKLMQILYNPGSINSVGAESSLTEEPGSNLIHLTLKGADDGSLSELVESLVLGETATKQTYHQLSQIKKILVSPLSFQTRLNFLESFNVALPHLANRFSAQMEIFQACVQTITLLRDVIEEKPQPNGGDSRHEWVEMEKAVFHLSQWENQVDFYWAGLH